MAGSPAKRPPRPIAESHFAEELRKASTRTVAYAELPKAQHAFDTCRRHGRTTPPTQ